MASIDYEALPDRQLRCAVTGRLDAETTSRLWPQALRKISQAKPDVLIVDAGGVEYCDGAGAALLLELRHAQERRGQRVQIKDLNPQFEQLMMLFDPGRIEPVVEKTSRFVSFVAGVGRTVLRLLEDFKAQVSFVGELSVKLLDSLAHLHRVRWKDTFLIAEKSGADAVGITALLGFLIGLILAFQSTVAMREFGAEIFVADLVTISLFRELGPLLTAFILASRSGSAFAAELGTMKVNEEIDALSTMGIDPVRFLVVPRIIAAVFATPLLTMFNNLFGLAGCALVMISVGFAPVAVVNQIREAATLGDLFGGLAKTLVFGTLIASIGCLRGLQTGTGASAVGDSATRAVVSSIVAIVVADGVFAVVYYFLGF
ncbi:MAG: MlaE family lipid ABC transporter permease subunit [Sedimentisphaerales bacterium]|jgi:phospholipid/cholesterol/gamma-HCH transport system permease protein